MQMKPNSIALLVGFTAICSWLGIRPSLNVLGHFVSVTVQKAAHYHLQAIGDFKIVLDVPTSNKGWKERFVWVTGDDLDLSCSTWPEIRKEALGPRPLSAAERHDLGLILAYSGPRKMDVLVDNSILRMAGISSVAAGDEDEIRALELMFGESPGEQVSPVSPAGDSTRPAKRSRQEPPPGATASAGVQAETAAGGAAPRAALGCWRTRWKKTSHGPRGPRRPREEAAVPMGVETCATGVRRETGSSSRPTDPAGRRGRESERTSVLESVSTEWPSRYFSAESETGVWERARDLLIGTLPSSSHNYDGEPDVQHRFDPKDHLDARSSVFGSLYAQGKAVEQFALPSDVDLLKEIPDVSLHNILRSYLVRGCLVEREVYHRMARSHRAFEQLSAAYKARERESGSNFEQVVKDLSTKQAELDDWRRELQVKEQLIEELRASDQRKSAEIERLRRGAGSSSRAPGSLSEALKERDVAVAHVALEKQVAEHAKARLTEESIARQRLSSECARLEGSLREVQSRVDYLESEEYRSSVVEERRPTIIEDFRRSAMGKFEVALACKAGCDYVASQVGNGGRERHIQHPYPPVISDYIDLLSKLEEAGAGYDVTVGEAEEQGDAPDSPSDGSDGGDEREAGGDPFVPTAEEEG